MGIRHGKWKKYGAQTPLPGTQVQPLSQPTHIYELVFKKMDGVEITILKSHVLVQVCWKQIEPFQCTHVLRWRKKTPFCCLRFVSLCNSTHVLLVTYFLLFVGFPTFSMMTFPWLPWSNLQSPRSSFTFVASRGTNRWLVVFGSTTHKPIDKMAPYDAWICEVVSCR